MNKCIQCESFTINVDPKTEICEVCYYREPLFKILSIIHKDGGEFTNNNGLTTSLEKALKIISDVKIGVSKRKYTKSKK